MLILLSSDIVSVQPLAALSRDTYINFFHLVLQRLATGLINEMAAFMAI